MLLWLFGRIFDVDRLEVGGHLLSFYWGFLSFVRLDHCNIGRFVLLNFGFRLRVMIYVWLIIIPKIMLRCFLRFFESEKVHHVVHNPTLCVPIFENIAYLCIIRLWCSLIKASWRAGIVIIAVVSIDNRRHLESLRKALIWISCYIMRAQIST